MAILSIKVARGGWILAARRAGLASSRAPRKNVRVFLSEYRGELLT
jgi:hypothetical protein